VSPQFETPWPFEARSEDIFVSEASEKWLLSGCGSFVVELEGSMVLTPDNQAAMSSLHLEGTMVDSVSHFPFLVTGELEVSPAETYGFE
jgi:hypothetical protein